jgi:nesprin-1
MRNSRILDQKEKNNIDRFMRDTGERWKNVSMELRCVQSMLEEVINYWRKWNSGAVEFEVWLEQAYQVLNKSEVEKMEFFQVNLRKVGKLTFLTILYL